MTSTARRPSIKRPSHEVQATPWTRPRTLTSSTWSPREGWCSSPAPVCIRGGGSTGTDDASISANDNEGAARQLADGRWMLDELRLEFECWLQGDRSSVSRRKDPDHRRRSVVRLRRLPQRAPARRYGIRGEVRRAA